MNHSTRIFPIGRLDKDSQGLIFLTNHGDLVNKILRAGNDHEKEYLVTVDKPVTDEFVRAWRPGAHPRRRHQEVQGEERGAVRVSHHPGAGLNRQIRRMCEHFGFEVTKLERIQHHERQPQGLPVGEWRDLTDDELIELFKLIEDSSSEAKPAKGLRLPSPRQAAAGTPAQVKSRGAATITRSAVAPMPGPEAFERKSPSGKGGQGKGAPGNRAKPAQASRAQGRAGVRRRGAEPPTSPRPQNKTPAPAGVLF